jgi:luciferase family oxidoreductase group 1
VQELLAFLGDGFDAGHPFARISASPVGVAPPELWMLGSSDFGGRFAAHLGWGFAFAHHINPGPAVATMRAYREHFRPSERRAAPHAILALSVICAATDDAAELLAAPVDLTMVRYAQGRPRSTPVSTDEALAHHYTPEEEALRRHNRARFVVGGVDRVRARVLDLVGSTGADEVMVTTMVPDHAARLRSYELLAEVLTG